MNVTTPFIVMHYITHCTCARKQSNENLIHRLLQGRAGEEIRYCKSDGHFGNIVNWLFEKVLLTDGYNTFSLESVWLIY